MRKKNVSVTKLMDSENSYQTFYRSQQQPRQQQPRQQQPRQQQSHQLQEHRQAAVRQHRQITTDAPVAANTQTRLDTMYDKFRVLAAKNDFQLTNAIVPPDTDDPMTFAAAVPAFEPESSSLEAKEDSKKIMIKHTAESGIAANAYPQVYRDAPFYQQPQSNLIINPVPFYLTIDSRDRDRSVWPNTNAYRIPLVSSDRDLSVLSPNVRYKNIYSISLLSCVVPNHGGVMFEPYLLLQINEIDRVYDSASPVCARAFTKLYFKEVCPSSKFYRLDKGVGDPLTKIYWPAPRASLESITLSFLHPDGTLFDFGPDNPLPDPVDPLLQTTITLEIRTFVTDSGKAIGHRNP
jgi:hypothetical protein